MSRTQRLGVLGVILLGGFWLRTQGMHYGLPAVYNMDEVAIMNRALTFGTGTLNPGNFLYPTFYFYVLFAWEGLTALVGLAMGRWESLAGFERQFFLDPTPLYASGRLLSALCGTATLVVVCRVGSRLRDANTGLIAAALLAVAPFAVQDAHYVKHDVPVTLLIMLVPLALTSSSPRRLIWAGAALGLATSTHYYAALAVTMLIVERVSAPEPWSARVRGLVVAGVTALVVFLAASPFLVPEWRTAWTDITQNRAIVMDRATDTAGAFGYLDTYLRWFGAATGSSAIAIFAVAGFFMAFERWRSAVLLGVFPMAFVLFIANTVPATRYLNPVLPFVALFAAAMLVEMTRRRWWSRPLLVAVVLLMAAPGAYGVGRFFRQADTRTLAQQWIEANVAPGSSILVQPYSVPLRQSREGLVEALRAALGDESRASVKFQRQLALNPYPAPGYRLLYLGDGGLDVDKIYISQAAAGRDQSLAALRQAGVQWVVMKRYNVPNPSLASLDQALAREGRLISTFSPYRPEADHATRAAVAPFEHNEDALLHPALERPGPVIELWRID